MNGRERERTRKNKKRRIRIREMRKSVRGRRREINRGVDYTIEEREREDAIIYIDDKENHKEDDRKAEIEKRESEE